MSLSNFSNMSIPFSLCSHGDRRTRRCGPTFSHMGCHPFSSWSSNDANSTRLSENQLQCPDPQSSTREWIHENDGFLNRKMTVGEPTVVGCCHSRFVAAPWAPTTESSEDPPPWSQLIGWLHWLQTFAWATNPISRHQSAVATLQLRNFLCIWDKFQIGMFGIRTLDLWKKVEEKGGRYANHLS